MYLFTYVRDGARVEIWEPRGVRPKKKMFMNY